MSITTLDCKEIQSVHPKADQSWVFIGRTDAEAETPILWPPDVKSWLTWVSWEGFGAGGEGDDRGWNGWMASLTWWTWVWVNSRNWWWTGRPGVLQFMGLQKVGHDWVTEMNWTELPIIGDHINEVLIRLSSFVPQTLHSWACEGQLGSKQTSNWRSLRVTKGQPEAKVNRIPGWELFTVRVEESCLFRK